MRKWRVALAMTAAMAAVPAIAQAQKPSAYPARNQSAEQQGTDDTQCLAWARQSTGIDPATFAAAPPAQPAAHGERLRGAAKHRAAHLAVGILEVEVAVAAGGAREGFGTHVHSEKQKSPGNKRCAVGF